MSVALSSIGIKTYYTVAPLSKTPVDAKEWIQVPEIKNIPSFNISPETIEVTSLEDEKYTRYVPGLRDLGGALEYTANITQELLDLWNGRPFFKSEDGSKQDAKTYYKKEGNNYYPITETTDPQSEGLFEHRNPIEDTLSVMYKQEHLEDNNVLWFCHVHPDLNQSTYVPFEPVEIQTPETGVNAAFEGDVNIVPIAEPRWDAKLDTRPESKIVKTFEEYVKEKEGE